MEEEILFQLICDKLSQENCEVRAGKMMSSPGIVYKNKVIAFYHKKQMIFRLGRDFKPAERGIAEYSLLSPFKTKPPLVDWFCIPFSESQKWEELARLALQRMTSTA